MQGLGTIVLVKNLVRERGDRCQWYLKGGLYFSFFSLSGVRSKEKCWKGRERLLNVELPVLMEVCSFQSLILEVFNSLFYTV